MFYSKSSRIYHLHHPPCYRFFQSKFLQWFQLTEEGPGENQTVTGSAFGIHCTGLGTSIALPEQVWVYLKGWGLYQLVLYECEAGISEL